MSAGSRRSPGGPRRDRPGHGSSRPAGGARSTPAGPRGRATRGGAGAGGWIVAALLLVWIVVLARHPRHARPSRDPLDGMNLNAAADSADALHKRGKFLEALAYVHYLDRVGEVTEAFESRAATAANNASIEVRLQHGMAIPATRASVERVGLIRESILRSRHAESMTATPALRCAYTAGRAGQLAVWGFVREAYAEYRRAATLAPLPPRALAEARWVEAMLQDPTRSLPPPPAGEAAAAAPATEPATH